MKRIRILFVISNSSLSGAESQLLLIANSLDKNKYDVEICCLDSVGSFTKAVKDSGIPIHIIERRKRFDIKRLIGIIKLIKVKNYDIINSFTWSANQYVRIARLFLRFKLVSGERGRFIDKKHMENYIDRILSPLSDLIIFNSEAQRDKYILINEKYAKKTMVIHNAVEVNRFTHKNNNVIKELIGLGDDTILIGTVGNFSISKNFDMFIELSNKLKDSKYKTHFVAIGIGPRKKLYEKIINSKNLSSHISLIGRREDLNNIFCELDIFVLSSVQEGMPNVILEAMASKVIVISTSVDGCKEIITDSVNGFLVKSNDVESMVHKISFILENPDKVKKMIYNAYSDINYKYTVKKMINKYDYYYRGLLGD